MENNPSEENRPIENSHHYAAAAPRSINPYVLPGSILLSALMIAGSIIYLVGNGIGGNNNGNANPPEAVVIENPLVPAAAEVTANDPVRGDANAPVLIIEYGDYQCPFCGVYFKDVEPVIMQKYVDTGKARFVFRHLAFLGPESVAAAEATECAREQGKFWEYHSALYAAEIADGKEHNENLNRTLFMKLAGDTGLDAASFGECIDSGKYKSLVEEANAAASAAGVYSTPTTFVNGKKVIVLDSKGNPVPDARTGDVQSVGANGQPIMNAIEAALNGS